MRAVVKRDKAGVWYCRPYLGRSKADGRPIRPYRSFPTAENEEEAQALADAWVETLAPSGRAGVRMELPDVLGLYVDQLEAFGHAPSTVDAYRSIVRCYVGRYLPKADPRELTTWDVSQFERRLLSGGGCDGRGLSPNTVRKVHSFLSGAFRWMRDEGLVSSSPMADARKPRGTQGDVTALTSQELGKLMDEVGKSLGDPGTGERDAKRRIAAFAAYVALECGLRIGEVCALSRSSISLTAMTLRVTRTASESSSAGFVAKAPKSKKSVRTIAISENVAKAVRSHEEWTDRMLSERGLFLDDAGWLVTFDGGLLRPSELRCWYSELRKAAGLGRHCRFHALRHTHATLLVAAGIDAKTVSERLGHANEATTLALYAHVMPGRDRAAADVMAMLET